MCKFLGHGVAEVKTGAARGASAGARSRGGRDDGAEQEASGEAQGPHHFTGITADVTANVDFWCRVLGLRFVKNTLNFETTFRYHTYFGDEEGHPGSAVTFLEFKEAPAGRPGHGDIFRLVLRVASYDSLEYWMDRLIANQTHSEMLRLDPTQPQSLVFQDPRATTSS
jgi:glyoxalase family protein